MLHFCCHLLCQASCFHCTSRIIQFFTPFSYFLSSVISFCVLPLMFLYASSALGCYLSLRETLFTFSLMPWSIPFLAIFFSGINS
uniref:Uncharacterized protein n=1 Tax=Arundo donax TaxID=35708 RepID=A0A0A9GJL7_ARUDO